jgi:hypothetical protein
VRAPTALALALPALCCWLLLGAGPAAAQTETETLIVYPGKAKEVTSETNFRQGVAYEVKVTGSIQFPSGDTQNPGTCHVDALYTICPPEENFRPDTGGEGIRVRNTANTNGNRFTLDQYSTGDRPGYSKSHSYAFVLDNADGRLVFTGYPFGGLDSCPQGCSGAITIEITLPDCDDGGGARAAAINEVRVVAVQPGAQWRENGKACWKDIEKNQVLQQGHELATDPDGQVTLAFADNSTVVLRHSTQIRIASFFTEGGVVRTELLLKNGELAATVNKSETTKSDFRIKPPAPVASVRGTKFSVFYDAVARAALYSVTEGEVKVGKLLLHAGQAVEAVKGKLGKPAPLGKAGARGGVNRADAAERVLKRIGKSSCDVSAPRSKPVGTAPTRGGWKVTVKLTGAVKGKSKWTVKGRKVKAVNKQARRVAKNCR